MVRMPKFKGSCRSATLLTMGSYDGFLPWFSDNVYLIQSLIITLLIAIRNTLLIYCQNCGTVQPGVLTPIHKSILPCQRRYSKSCNITAGPSRSKEPFRVRNSGRPVRLENSFLFIPTVRVIDYQKKGNTANSEYNTLGAGEDGMRRTYRVFPRTCGLLVWGPS